ncbi:MAG: FHA domain-containing protein [Calothrix sp. SM1_7_51]|nr:FHA domain-containing protein [Calothrix sp. SM1_7_51]
MYSCSKGHQSTEADYCSECGTKISGIVESVSGKNTVSDGNNFSQFSGQFSGMICPDCSTHHELDSGNFCEICGYNFSTGRSGEIPGLKKEQNLEESTKKQADIYDNNLIKNTDNIEEINSTKLWKIVITIDSEARYSESPEPPINQAPIILALEKPINLIGRNSKARAVYPEIALDFDDAVSHRHAVLNRNDNGTFTLRDIGSANGTTINGVELKPMVDIPLKNGDEFTLGHWTKIQITHNS